MLPWRSSLRIVGGASDLMHQGCFPRCPRAGAHAGLQEPTGVVSPPGPAPQGLPPRGQSLQGQRLTA